MLGIHGLFAPDFSSYKPVAASSYLVFSLYQNSSVVQFCTFYVPFVSGQSSGLCISGGLCTVYRLLKKHTLLRGRVTVRCFVLCEYKALRMSVQLLFNSVRGLFSETKE